MLSHIKLTGNLKVSVHDYIRDSWEVVCDDKNLIVTSGLGVVPSLLTLNVGVSETERISIIYDNLRNSPFHLEINDMRK